MTKALSHHHCHGPWLGLVVHGRLELLGFQEDQSILAAKVGYSRGDVYRQTYNIEAPHAWVADVIRRPVMYSFSPIAFSQVEFSAEHRYERLVRWNRQEVPPTHRRCGLPVLLDLPHAALFFVQPLKTRR